MFRFNKGSQQFRIKIICRYLAALIIVCLAMISLSGCSRSGSAISQKSKDERLKEKIRKDLKSMALSGIESLRIGNVIELPQGKIREVFVKLKGKKMNAYLHISPESEEIVYAGLDDINEQKPVRKETIKAVKASALNFISMNKSSFNGFDFVDSDAGIDFPKKGYVTYVWQDKDKQNFVKITVNSIDSKVVSFGRGNKDWTMFCLPPGYLDIDPG